jgi:hypothetical protein
MTEERVLTEAETKEADRINELASFLGHMFATFGVDFAVGASALTVALLRASQTLFSVSKESFLEMIGETWDTVAEEVALKKKASGESVKDQIIAELEKRGIKVNEVKSATVRVEPDGDTEVERTLRTVISGAAGGE